VKLEFHPAAERELDAAVTDGARYGRTIGARIRSEAWRVTRLLCETPGIGTPLSPRLRQYFLRRYPFSVIYRLDGDALRIIAFAHKRRKPGYWQSRR
jgi:plasmid stabilization system protein ParE